MTTIDQIEGLYGLAELLGWEMEVEDSQDFIDITVVGSSKSYLPLIRHTNIVLRKNGATWKVDDRMGKDWLETAIDIMAK